MVVTHRISECLDVHRRALLASLGVRVPEGDDADDPAPLVSLDVREDHPSWPALERLFKTWDSVDMATTVFAPEETRRADWLRVQASSHQGYPQPKELEFGYLAATYDLKSWCEACSMGKIQNAPFQMKGEPRWGRRGILQMNWVFDEFFVKPDVWTAVFEPHGVPCREVIDRKGRVLETVVQLDVRERQSIQTDGLPYETCAICRRRKFLPFTRGYFPAFVAPVAGAIARTNEQFGSGAKAFQEVVVRASLAHAMREHGVRGVDFWPMAG